jgi:hypothetical protein
LALFQRRIADLASNLVVFQLFRRSGAAPEVPVNHISAAINHAASTEVPAGVVYPTILPYSTINHAGGAAQGY